MQPWDGNADMESIEQCIKSCQEKEYVYILYKVIVTPGVDDKIYEQKY